MKLSKVIFIIGFLAVVTGFYLQFIKRPTINILSSNQQFLSQLNLAIFKTNLDPTKPIDCNFRLKQCRITTNQINLALISTKKDPLYQITALQKISTTAKMNHRMVQLIDLAGSNYYATLQNN
jgi:hypothetical protein